MSVGLASFPEHMRATVAQRRVKNNTKGLGYWGAVDFLDRKKISQLKKKPATELTEEEIKEAVELHRRGKI